MIRRLILAAAVTFVVIAGIAAAGLYWLLSGDGVRRAIETQATAWLGQPVTIGSVVAQFFPRPGVTLRDVRAGNPVRLRLANVQLSAGFRPLLSRRVDDAEIIVSDSRIEMPLPFAMPGSATGDGSSNAAVGSSAVHIGSIRAITLRNVVVASRGREIVVSADSSLSSAHLNVERFTATAGRTLLQASGLVQLTPRLDAQIKVVADHVDVDDLIALAGAFAPHAERKTPTTAVLSGRVVARISAATARASGIDVRNFATTLVAQGDRIALSPVTFQIFGGQYQGSISIDTEASALGATIRAQIAGLDVAQLASFGGVPDTISGLLSGSGTFNGRGATIADALAAAAGEGTISIADGAMRHLGLVRTVVLFFGRPQPSAASATDAFERLDATFGLARRVVSASALSLHSPDLDLVGQGRLGLADKTLAGHLDLSLSESLSAQAGSDLLRYTREGNRVILPAVVSGTLAAPHVSIDAGAAVRRGLRNEVQERLKGILRGLKPS